MNYKLHLGDNREVLRSMPSDSVDSIVCDPPYELGFMGKRWDSTGIAYDVTLWAECLRVLKPGGHLLAFGGSRTYHRLAVAIEDAGFEIRDCIMWLYGSGFPKSYNLDGEHQGWGTALKPAHEPIVVARKPLQGTVADNVTAWGVGALNIDGCRVGMEGGTKAVNYHSSARITYQGLMLSNDIEKINAGRWPANIILDEEAAQMLDEQSGWSASKQSQRGAVEIFKKENGWIGESTLHGHSDSGGASRFFYVAKASKAEREAGLEGMPMVRESDRVKDDGVGGDNPRNRTNNPRINHHPTVKPIALMRYLVRMVTPRDGVVLDPFMGSGTTGCAAMLEGMNFIGIDITPEYKEIAERRIQYWASQNPMELSS